LRFSEYQAVLRALGLESLEPGFPI
jgi:hypothetical protein